jgi:peptidoglycan/xylan/chitin deacetylase (PgdA/CDA1 family)
MARVAILSYHKIGEPPEDGWESWYYVSRALFRAHLQLLLDEGWTPIDGATLLGALDDPDRLDAPSVLITFDDGYQSLVAEALPVLEDLGFPGVVFVPTAYVGGTNEFDQDDEPEERICSWDDLLALRAGGVAIESHGVRHCAMSTLERSERETELRDSRGELEAQLGRGVRLFAFPYGDDGDDHVHMAEALRRSGYDAACLYGGGAFDLRDADRYRLPRLAMGPDTDLLELLGAN